MELTAGAASRDDLETLTRLLSEAAEAAGSERGGPLFVRLEMPEPERFLEASDHVALLGEIDGARLGVALVRLLVPRDGEAPVGRLELLYVEPEARGVGLGEVLVKEAASWAAGRGACGLDAVVLPGAREAKNFLESSGFVARLIVMHRAIGGPEW